MPITVTPDRAAEGNTPAPDNPLPSKKPLPSGNFGGNTPASTAGTGSYEVGDTAATEDELEFVPGGDNQEFYQDQFGNAIGWQEYLLDRLEVDLKAAAKALGEDPFAYLASMKALFPGMLHDLQKMQDAGRLPGTDPNPMSVSNLGYLYQMARLYLGSRDGRLNYALGFQGKLPSSGGGGGRGGGGGGPRKLTADEIRAQFDLDALASAANDIFRGLILDDAKDPRAIASAYVEAIVKNPDQKLDYQTFVEKMAMNTPRFASIYRNKPDALSPQQYIQPYLQAALQMARPTDAAKLATGGAQMGADPNAFRARLARTNAQVTSAPFIAGLEQRLESLRGVLKG